MDGPDPETDPDSAKGEDLPSTGNEKSGDPTGPVLEQLQQLDELEEMVSSLPGNVQGEEQEQEQEQEEA